MKLSHAPLIAGAAACLLFSAPVLAQSTNTQDGKAQARAERRAQGTEAAREFKPGEGNPVPESKPKASKDERAKARQARKPEGAAASRTFRPGEGDPKPVAVAKQPADERRAERSAKRDEVKAANKSGQIPNYGENYGAQK